MKVQTMLTGFVTSVMLSSQLMVMAQVSPFSERVGSEMQMEQFPCALGGGCQEDIISTDPTFIQVSTEKTPVLSRVSAQGQPDALTAEIFIPTHQALVRANVPIFGKAHGKKFKEYRVEYGQGSNPTHWELLRRSTTPQTQNVTPNPLYLSADLSIEGNLGTWDTGLKNYVYLPTHPPDHPINLKGTYTIRLVVISTDGQRIEDRVTVHVANVIPNAWGGQVISPDEQVRLSIQEQSITAPFRLILIQSTNQRPKISGHGRQLIGDVYEVKEPGERFTKSAVLEIKIPENLHHSERERMAIYGYDPAIQEWVHLPTFQQEIESGALFTRVRRLHALYAVMSTNRVGEGSDPIPVNSWTKTIHQVNAGVPTSQHYLVQEDFEKGVGSWSNRDGQAGATVSIDGASTFDGTKALKIVNSQPGGNFAVNIRTTPFSAREFPIIEFDYRMDPGVKTNLYAKVSGRWYQVRLTDDPMELLHKRVNIAQIGTVPDIVADGEWHATQFNFYDMLRTKTGNFIVDELIMADWDVTGYMRLQYGHNPAGATYYIDNFGISREIEAGLHPNEDVLVVDNFNQKKGRNHFRRPMFTFQNPSNPASGIITIAFASDDASGRGHSLVLSYDVSRPKTYSGYATTLPRLDLRGFYALSFSVKSADLNQDMFVGIRDSSGQERKILLSTYHPERLDTDWKRIEIPLTVFGSELNWGAVENVSFSFAHMSTKSKGTILLDDIQFHKHVRAYHVDSFEQWHGKNLLGGEHRTFANGAAAINGTYTRGSPNGLYRLSYGGNIGAINAYASDLLTYAGWATDLGGVDCSRCSRVSFRVRGGEGGERPNIYLDDGNVRWGVNLEDYMTVSTEWQSVAIPLEAFAQHGVDLTHLETLQVVFEWEQMSGTLYLDDIWFGTPSNSQP
ncbi:MAG: hypothetical protein MRJ96_15265 [Nitrospirales bacterium]|nr:hypothetical protein [Nitrospira sp.]MDR4502802.1 hypothetical protein [Nitrospirales bacterium]